jgi:DnaJ-domain-containing protein 1
VSTSETAAAVAAVAAETVVEAPARGAQRSPVRERCSSWRADGDHEKRVDGFRDARLKLVSASETAAAVAAVAAETVVEAPARGAQLSPVRERCSSWRVTTAPAKACARRVNSRSGSFQISLAFN